jgi:hypothetical protein
MTLGKKLETQLKVIVDKGQKGFVFGYRLVEQFVRIYPELKGLDNAISIKYYKQKRRMPKKQTKPVTVLAKPKQQLITQFLKISAPKASTVSRMLLHVRNTIFL